MIKIFNEEGNLVFRGSIVEGIELLEISKTHYYQVTSGKTDLTYRAKYPEFVVKGITYKRSEKQEIQFDIGYSFTYKGYPVTITDIRFDDITGMYVYTINDDIEFNALRPYQSFNTLWQAVDRAIKL